MSESSTVDFYRTPEIKTLIKLTKDPRPNKILLNYIKASAKQSSREFIKAATWQRPLDSFKEVGGDLIGSAAGLAGARAGASIGRRLIPQGPYGMLAGTIIGGMAGGISKTLINKGIQVMEERVDVPEILTHVDILSERQSKLSDLGSAIGLATGVPLAALAIAKGINPLAAIGSAIGSAYLASKVGNGLGNMAGYILDQRNNELH